jgi:hypothetical protein
MGNETSVGIAAARHSGRLVIRGRRSCGNCAQSCKLPTRADRPRPAHTKCGPHIAEDAQRFSGWREAITRNELMSQGDHGPLVRRCATGTPS